LARVLPIQPVLYVVPDINLIDNLVSVFLQSRRENHDLVVACHCLDELNTARSHEEEAVVLILDVMDQSLIQIQN